MTRLQWGAALGALLVAAHVLLSDFGVLMLAYVGLYALVALGLVMLTGVAGMTSFGQAAFAGLGAYATALASTSPQFAAWLHLPAGSAWLPWIGLAAGLAFTVAVAFVLGRVTTGLAGHYLPLGTIAWAISLAIVFGNLELLGGHTGLTGVPVLQVGEVQLASPRSVGALAWGVVLAALWLLHNLLDSRHGRSIRALKSARGMAESMGVDTSAQRLRVFVLAAVLASVSGWLYAHLQRFVSPAPFGLSMGVEYLFMTVIGGAGHLAGAIVGAGVVTLAKQQLQGWLPSNFGNFEAVVFGILMLLVLHRAPQGLWGAISARRAQRWMRATAATRRVAPAELPGRKPLPPGEVVLRADGVTRRFGGLYANRDVSLELRSGQIHALIGPNGAGKSTFFNLLSGVDDPTEGRVEIRGETMQGQPPRAFAARGLARTFQHVQLLLDRPALDNVTVGGHLRGAKGWWSALFHAERAEEAALVADAEWQLSRCGLQDPAALAGNLPLGQQRLLEIARALAAHPHILLLDEPAAGLRPEEKKALARLLCTLRDEGLAVLVVEHDMDFVMEIADTITVLSFGTVIARGVPNEVQRNVAVREAYLGSEEPEATHV